MNGVASIACWKCNCLVSHRANVAAYFLFFVSISNPGRRFVRLPLRVAEMKKAKNRTKTAAHSLNDNYYLLMK